MKRILFFILTFTCCSALWAQDITRQFHIVDARTGEALPYVSVYVTSNRSTISNYDGDFTLTADANQHIKISYVGYEPLDLVMGEMPDVIQMKVLSKTLHQVTIMPSEGILEKVTRQLEKEYGKRKKNTGKYFTRVTATMGDREELMEAFLEAKSAVNLRDLEVLSGRRGQVTKYGMTKPLLSNINFQHVLELGPMIQDVNFWHDLTQPLHNRAKSAYFRKNYSMTCEVLGEELGEKLYCIDLQKRDTAQAYMLVGKLYVDAKTYQIQRFEGEITDMWIEVISKNQLRAAMPVTTKLNISYTHSNGYTEVDDISCEIGQGELHSQIILQNVSGLDMKFKKKKKKKEPEQETKFDLLQSIMSGNPGTYKMTDEMLANIGAKMGIGYEGQDNILRDIDEAGFDSILWAHAGIVQRTAYEERLARQQAELNAIAVTQNTGNAKLDAMLDRLRLFGQRIPQEKVYLHLDNSCYFLGDTIWFAAYSRRTNDDHPSDISNIIYVELINNDGYVMERKTLKMKDGRSYGNFYLDPEFYSGFYELRAYTRWQMNWGEYTHHHGEAASNWFTSEEREKAFYRDYDKLYSRVVPVYDKPEDPSTLYHDMTLRPMRRYFKKDPDKRELTVSFFPEGGNLVEGVPCRVAYEATWNDGEWAEGTLTIGNIQAPTLHRGRGYFEFTPRREEAKSLKPMFLTADSVTTVKTELPEIQPSGASLQVNFKDDEWKFDIALTPDLEPDSMAITLMHEGVLAHVFPVTSRNQQNHIPSFGLQAGVNQITLFDANGRVWADRLFFVTDTTLNTPTLTIEGMKDEYEPYEKISLGIQSTSPAKGAGQPLSLSIRDALNQDYLYDNGNMMTEMLLASEIKGFVPKPEWYFEKDDEEHRQGLDLLMMTQGWRRFAWREMAVRGEWDLKYPDEKNMVMEGVVGSPITNDDVRLYLESLSEGTPVRLDKLSQREIAELKQQIGSSAPKNELLVHAELIDPFGGDNSVCEVKTDKQRFRIKMPDFYGTHIFFLSTADATKWKPNQKYNWVEMDSPNNSARYTPYITQQFPRFVKPYNFYQKNLAPAPVYEGKKMKRFSDGTIQLDELSVTSKRNRNRRFQDSEPAFFVDAYEAYNNAMDAGLSTDFEGIVRSYIGDLGLERPYASETVPVYNEEGMLVGTKTEQTSRIKLRYGPNVETKLFHGFENEDSTFYRNHLWSEERDFEDLAPGMRRYYHKVDSYNQATTELDFSKLDKFVIYTDYCPRLEGSYRYYGSNLPDTRIALYPFLDDGRRAFYRDRRFVLPGFAICKDFYSPDYSQRPLPEQSAKDYRRTLYWNPNLQLDSNGHANVTLYNCSRTTSLNVTAEGITESGAILTGSAE